MSKFLKVIVNLFLVCAILVAGALLVPPLLGVSTTMVDSSAMDTNLAIGSVTYSKNVNVAEVSVGDKILVESETGAYAYIVDSADAGEGKFIVTDAENPQSESTEIARRNDVLKIFVTIPLIGYILIAMRSVEGLIIIGLVVLFVIILFILSELWKKVDDEEDEEEDEDAIDESQGESEDRIAGSEGTKTIAEEPQDVYVAPITELTTDELARAVAELHSIEQEPEKVEVEETVAEPEAPEVKEEAVDLELPDLEEVVEDDRNSFVPVARPSKEEILNKAKAAGEEPEVVEYEALDVTIIDYSDLI